MVEIGAILEGKVTGLTNFGAFVSLPENATGMVHISEVASTYVSDIHEYLTENQEVKVKVIDVTPEGKISLSIKKAMEPEQTERPVRRNTQNRSRSNANVWKGSFDSKKDEPASFEDMMAKFKQVSDEKMTDLKRATDGKRNSYSRKK
ncbi:MAG: S1 RNA-binding domain-containing protein [Oscillospiraceae bacterium]